MVLQGQRPRKAGHWIRSQSAAAAGPPAGIESADSPGRLAVKPRFPPVPASSPCPIRAEIPSTREILEKTPAPRLACTSGCDQRANPARSGTPPRPPEHLISHAAVAGEGVVRSAGRVCRRQAESLVGLPPVARSRRRCRVAGLGEICRPW